MNNPSYYKKPLTYNKTIAMLKADWSYTVLKKVVEPGLLWDVTSARPNKWEVVDWEWYKPGDVVYFIPHSAMPVEDNDGTEYLVVPKDQIVCRLLPDSTVSWTQPTKD